MVARARSRAHVSEDDLISPIIAITHAAFDAKRRLSVRRLESQLRLEAPGIPVYRQNDEDQKGSLWCWRRAMEHALSFTDITHVIWIPDDAIVCADFGRIVEAAIEARPNDVFDCYVNMPEAEDRVGQYNWYTTLDGYTGVGGVMPRALLREHLAWRDEHPELAGYPNDAGVNLWAMAHRRPILKTTYSLVKHDTSLPSLEGHGDDHERGIEMEGKRFIDEYRKGINEDVMNFVGRTYAASEEHMPGHRANAVDLGRTYATAHEDLITRLNPPDVKGYWWAQRNALNVSKEPFVYIAIPNRGDIQADVTTALISEATHLQSNGVGCQIDLRVRDSLITRSRDRIVANFMASRATHLLFWDSDIIPTEPGFIKKLLDTGHHLVAGAAPFKNDTGHVVCVPDEAFLKDGCFDMPVSNGCVEVKCAGTGIMMMTRECIGRLTEAHMDKLYVVNVPGVIHRLEWALFEDRVRGFDRLSEDWEFCFRWRDLGEHVYVQPDLEFRHVGVKAYEGSFHGQYGGA